MSLTETSTSAPPVSPGGLRLEDALRLLLAALVVLAGGLALGGFTFSQLAGRGTAYFVLALALAVVLTALAYYRFAWCLAAFVLVIWVSFGRTPDLATGVSSGTGKALFPAELGTLFLLFVWLLRALGGKARPPWTRTPLDVPLCVYLAFCAWTATNGALFWDIHLTRFYAGLGTEGRTAPPVIAIELLLRALSAGAFWLMASNLTETKWQRRASVLLAVPGFLVFLSHLHVLPALGNVYDTLLTIATATLLWAWLLDSRSRHRALRAWGWALLAALVFQVFFLNLRWISGWTGLFAGLLFVAWLRSRRLFAGLALTGTALALAAAPFLQANVIHKMQQVGDFDRFALARGALLYALHFPLGIGPGNYRAYNFYYGAPAQWNTTTYTSAHNFYAQALAEMGFGGLLVTLWMVISGLALLARWYRQMPSGWARTATLGIAGQWAGLCAASFIGDYLVPVYHNGGLANMATTLYAWLGLGLAAALAHSQGVLWPRRVKRDAPPVLPPAALYYPRRLSPPSVSLPPLRTPRL